MAIIGNIRHWFQKRESAIPSFEVAREQMSRFNALLKSDPKDLTNAITCFDSGNLAPLARLVEEYERRDDKMKTCSMKMKASVGRCDYSIQKLEGFESDPRADVHADILRRFWSTVRTTSTFKRNETGGFNLLKKQMMDAQSYGFAVHEIVWTPTADGELRAQFIQVPLWHFENRTGHLRFLPTTTRYTGIDMNPGEWMVTTGDGVGIAASLCACMKRMSLVDWMVYNERCGTPLLHGSTGAAFASDQWNNLNRAIRNIARYTQILTDSSTKIEAIPLGGGASIPYPQLVEWCDRAIASLYRGADLSTMSQGGDGVGASLQGDESDMLEQDACGRLSDTLNEAVDRFVIRYVTGDDEPLARIVVEPVSKPNVDTDIKIDQHLVALGVKLSKNDALQRYGRMEADPNDDEDAPLAAPAQPPVQGAFSGFANESKEKVGGESRSTKEDNPPLSTSTSSLHLLQAFAHDTGPLAKAVEAFLQNPSKEAADTLLTDLPNLVPDDPALAAVIAEEMAKQFSVDGRDGAPRRPNEEGLANSGHPYTKCPGCGKFMSPNGSCQNCGFVEDDDRLIARGKNAIEQALTGNRHDVPDAMYRKGLGAIDFDLGWRGKGPGQEHGSGLLKMDEKHFMELQAAPETIVKGDIVKLEDRNNPGHVDPNSIAIIRGTNIAILNRKGDNDRWGLFTHFSSESGARKRIETSKNLKAPIV